ncbi:unnamed protein product [Pleuronectes platessa]|uniref:Uncharacterized protein n=1 Tax=Pleuronectes platessa TaxID=8262 RepID=A0A9N7YL57_PLEPL|nr:unnamed protein product [Pleuronectes platessa]
MDFCPSVSLPCQLVAVESVLALEPADIRQWRFQLDGHQHPARALLPPSDDPLCLSGYGSMLLIGPGLRHRLAHGLEEPADEAAPAPPRILFLILARLLLLLFRGGRLHLGGVSGRRRALWGRRERGSGGEQGRRVTSGGKEREGDRKRGVGMEG